MWKTGRQAVGVVAITAGAILLCCTSAAKNKNVQDPVVRWIGAAAPDIRLTTLDGSNVALADYHGKIVVLHFGASW